MATCNLEKLTADIDRNCDVIVPGVENIVYAINFEDVNKALSTFDGSNELTLDGIVLTTSSPAVTAFTMEGQKNSFVKECTFAPSKFVNGWMHKLTGRVFDNDPIAKKRVTELANGKFIVIVKNIYKNANKVGTPNDSTYEVYGWANGLNASVINNTDADTRGGWYFELASIADYPEPNLPYAFFKTSIAATDALIAALL